MSRTSFVRQSKRCSVLEENVTDYISFVLDTYSNCDGDGQLTPSLIKWPVTLSFIQNFQTFLHFVFII